MNEPRRIQCPFVDTQTKDVVAAFFFDGHKPEWGGESEPPSIVTIPVDVRDVRKKDIQTGLWSQEAFRERFKIVQ